MDRSWVVAAVAAVAVGALLLWPGGEAAPPAVEVVARPASLGRITVHVSGAVLAPGLVSLPAGSRVADAVMAAGGATEGAGLTALNLAASVSDGQQLVVPGGEEASGGAVAQEGRVAINSADAAALEALPGVGPVLAQRIVEHREQYGAFSTPEDLLDVPGIGEAKLAAIRDSVLVP